MPQVLSYDDKKYNRKKALYDVIVQILQDLKIEENGMHSWNKLVQDINGLTGRLLGNGSLEITHHRIEVCTVEGLVRQQEQGKKFLANILKELKKRFKKYTGKPLKLTKVSENQSIEKYAVLQADTSWMIGSSRYGYGSRSVGKYLIKDSCVYDFDIDTLV